MCRTHESERLRPGEFCGEATSKRAFGPLLASCFEYQPHLKIPRHAHEGAYFSLVLAGGYDELVGTASRTCLPNNVLFHPEGEEHSEILSSHGATVFSIEPSQDWLDMLRLASPVLREHRALRGGPAAVLCARMYDELREPDECSALVLEGLTLGVLGLSARKPTPKADATVPQWLQKAREMIEQCYCEPLSHEAIAAAVGVHPVHLARTYRRVYGDTIGSRIRAKRLASAAARLEISLLPISQIAFDAGFNEPSHFAKAFRRHYGCSPAAYRQRHKG